MIFPSLLAVGDDLRRPRLFLLVVNFTPDNNDNVFAVSPSARHVGAVIERARRRGLRTHASFPAVKVVLRFP